MTTRDDAAQLCGPKAVLCVAVDECVFGSGRGLITKTSYDFLKAYLKLDHKSIVSSRPSGTMLCALSYDYRKLITKSDLRKS